MGGHIVRGDSVGGFRHRARILATMGTALAVAVSLLTVGVPLSARADSPAIATITGTVTAETGGAPLTFPLITLYMQSGTTWKFYDYTSGGRDGTYQFQNVPVGTYTLEFSPEHGDDFVTEWWNDEPTDTAANPIAVTTATTTVTADAALATGATISGTITSPATSTFTLVPDMELLKSDGKGGWLDAGLWAYPAQDGSGRFSIVGVPAGDYTVYYGDDASQSDIAPLYYQQGTSGTPSEWAASSISVAAQQTLTGIDATFEHGVSVTGKVTDYWGNPLSNVTVSLGRAVEVAGQTQWQVWSVKTDSSGTFSDTRLPAGTWALEYTKSGYATIDYPVGGGFDLEAGKQKAFPTMKLYRTLVAATPGVSGTVAMGFTLTAKPGTWTSGTSLSYAWYADGAYISGSSGPTHAKFTLTYAQKDKRISVKVTGTKTGYAKVSRLSGLTAKVALTSAPTIVGMPRVGSTLGAHPWMWTSGTTFAYRWYAGGIAITGATHSSFRLTSAQWGKTITVKVTGSKSGYMTISRMSVPTPKVT